MSGDPERVYFDANVFLSLIDNEAARVPTISGLIEECKLDGVEIVTSALSITEVAFAAAEQKASELSPAELAKINALWEPGSPFIVAELHQLVASDARDVIRESMIETSHTLKPADAIHLATALRVGATHFYTFDERVQRLRHSRPIKILAPTLRHPQLFVPEAT
jgi:predicted nucleic acid-binding protein